MAAVRIEASIGPGALDRTFVLHFSYFVGNPLCLGAQPQPGLALPLDEARLYENICLNMIIPVWELSCTV